MRPQVKQGLPATAFQKAAKGDAKHAALQQLQNSLSRISSLGAATAAVDFLESMRLFYCTDCEEE